MRSGKKGILLVLALTLGITIWHVDRTVHQARLDRQLIAAVKQKKHVAVSALLRQGANPSSRALPPPGSLLEQVKRLFLHPPGSRAKDYPTALLIALRHGDLASAWALVEAKADPNAMDKEHVAPLALALSGPDELDDWRNWDQNAANHFAARLLDNDANPNARDANGTPVLMLAIQRYSGDSSERLTQEIVRKMIRKGADVNARDAQGKTALFWSAWTGFPSTNDFPEVMCLLLESGADPRPQKNAGWSILDCAAYFGDIKLAHAILAKGLTVNTPDDHGRTALHVASSQRKARFVRFLLDHGANTNAADHFGMTSLMFAVQNDDAETARLLLGRGASRKAKDTEHGWTAERLARLLHAERCLTLFKTGKIMPPVPSRTLIANRVPLDANRWLVVRYSVHPQIVEGGFSYNHIVSLVSRNGRQHRITSLYSNNQLKINVFRDRDGSPVVFVRGDEHGEGASLCRFEGMQAKEVWNVGTRYGSDFRPLKDGGCVVWTWQPAFLLFNQHVNDDVCLPFYYRNGKYKALENLYFPGGFR